MLTIYKYQIPIQDNFELELPRIHLILTVQIQNNIPYIWIEVDTESPLYKIPFHIYGTGHDLAIPYFKKYIGTFQKDGFVWHLFGGIGESPVERANDKS